MLATVKYFLAMLTSRLIEDESGEVYMTHYFPKDLAYPLMDYIYLGKVHVTSFEKLLGLLSVSNKLGFEV